MNSKKSIFKSILPFVAVLAIGMAFTVDAQAADFFDRLQAVTQKLPIVKVALVYLAFLAGLIACIWAAWDMVKLSRPDNRGEAKWSGVLILFLAGAAMVGLSSTSDIMQQTLFGSGNSVSSPNTSMIIPQDSHNA